jgi:asparagine synthase (glutamine-hydrolysing)
MCGIAGIFDISGPGPISRGRLKRMSDALHHRGPDGEGFHIEPGIGFGHRRLSIIDIEGGHQPMCNEDGSVVIIFNGEIYDYEPLRIGLQRRGHKFSTRSDTETIIHAWEEWGTECLEHLSGMFAFAIWDRNRRQLFLARDRLGKKPLYYSLIGRHLVFASELDGIAGYSGSVGYLSATGIQDYFAFGYVPRSRCIYEGVFQLPPGCFMVVEAGRAVPVPQRYWRPRFDARPIGEGLAAEQLRELLTGAVARRLVADVPIGAFLSGGVDSSGVVALMASLRADPISTFTIGLGAEADETIPAEITARRLGTAHTAEAYDVDYIEAARGQATLFGEPFADSSSVPTYRVSHLARRTVTVALSGDGGDELFAGYRRYRWHLIGAAVRRYLPSPLRRRLFRSLARLYPHLIHAPQWLRAKQTLTELGLDSALAYYRMICRVRDEQRNELMSPAFISATGEYDSAAQLAELMESAETEDPLAQAMYADMHTWLAGDILVKVDRASMANSLEVRTPFLDHHLVEWAATLPRRLLIDRGQGKLILKRALKGLVGDDVLTRPKRGFSKPLAEQFRGLGSERLRQRLLGSIMLDSGYFNPRGIAQLIDTHDQGVRDNSASLWSLLVFEGFLARAEERLPMTHSNVGSKLVAVEMHQSTADAY